MKKSLHRPKQCHKGDFGHAWIIAGAQRMAGAGCLAVSAAIRSGAGKTTWVTTPESYRVMGRAVPEAMTLLAEAGQHGGFAPGAIVRILKQTAAQATAVAIGPGLGRTPATRKLVTGLLARIRVPMVLDADALWALEGNLGALQRAAGPIILTPHAGELKRLFGPGVDVADAVRGSVAKRITNQYHCVLVWKGSRTLVAVRDEKDFLNTTGNPGLAKGGSGDVLTGIIAGLLAQGLDAGTAARVGVFAHGRAADIALQSSSVTGLAASDLLKALPAVWPELESKSNLARFAAAGFQRGR